MTIGDIVGCSCFGLGDAVAWGEDTVHEEEFYVADAILPRNPLGIIRVGRESEQERIHSGIYWPIEARIDRNCPIRRAPIPYVWRALVEAQDRRAWWRTTGGVSYPLARILASHVRGILRQVQLKGTTKDPVKLVVAIPDHLDEFGQEEVLRELNAPGEGLVEIFLLWRPVAAALAWLRATERDFPIPLNKDDHIHLIYMGPDALELTTLRLRVKELPTTHYILPLRDRPLEPFPWTGMDIASTLIETTMGNLEDGEFWQLFTTFPEIWKAIAGKPQDQNVLPRIWARQDGWHYWSPPLGIEELIWTSSVAMTPRYEQILRSSCSLRVQKPSMNGESWGSILKSRMEKMIARRIQGRVRGVIIYGPLAQSQPPPWVRSLFPLLSERGIDCAGPYQPPRLDALWLPGPNQRVIAKGCALYGQRLERGQPTYLDTLPQLCMLARKNGRPQWVSLVNAEEVEGGKAYENPIIGIFIIPKDKNRLDIYLQKGSGCGDTRYDQQEDTHYAVEPSRIPRCLARVIRKAVRMHGRYERVYENWFFKQSTAEARYGLSYARVLYGKKNQNQDSQAALEVTDETPYRKAEVRFPEPAPHDISLDIKVYMKPASGLAKVTISPQDRCFLDGRSVPLDYSTMERIRSLPSFGRGWPPIEEIPVHPEDAALREGEKRLQRFFAIDPLTLNYIDVVDSVKNILTTTYNMPIGNIMVPCRTIDQHGKACTDFGSEIVDKITFKFDEDFMVLNRYSKWEDLKVKIMVRSSWLYSKTPYGVAQYIRQILDATYIIYPDYWLYALEAGSRCFQNREEYQLLVNAVCARAKEYASLPFPIQAARSVCRLLMLREDGYEGLNRETATIVVQQSIRRMEEIITERNFKKLYFQLVRLLFYVLRFRKKDDMFLAPKKEETIELKKKIIEGLDKAKQRVPLTQRHLVEGLKNGFIDFIDYRGTDSALPMLNALAGEDY